MAKKRSSTTQSATETNETQAATEETQSPETQTEETTSEATATEETTSEGTGENVASEPSEETTHAEGETTPEPDPEPAVAEEDVEQAEDEPTATDELVETSPKELKSLAYQLGEYISAMKPGLAQNVDSLQKNQMRLRSVVNATLQLPDEMFGDGMKLLIGAIRKNRDGVFGERFVFRAFPQLRISRPERQKLETLVSLFLATADTKSPKSVTKNVDLNVVMRFVTDNDQQQKLQSYYGG